MRTFTNIVAGIAGGLLGSVLIGELMKRQQKLPEKLRGPEVKEHPGMYLARQAERVVGPVSEEARGKLAHLLHFAYGVFFPTALGAVASKAGLDRGIGRALLAGAGLGALVWAIGYVGWLPATGLAQPVHRQGATHVASSLAGHVGYGIAAALPLAAASKLHN